jgi:myo-inositol-1(or 4)-monophosphatase
MNHIEIATEIAYEAGRIMLRHFNSALVPDIKEDGTPVTIADHEINAMVIETLSREFPEDGIIGEERSLHVDGAKRVWVCDPLDGTLQYAAGMPVSSFSLALCEDGVPIFGITHNPFSQRTYGASKGQGATLNGIPIHVSDIADLKGAVINNDAHLLNGLNPILKQLGAQTTRNRSAVSSGSLVANGGYTAVMTLSGIGPWDIAALKIIVEEAGGKVTDRDGNDQRYDMPLNGAVVSNGHIHDALISLIREQLAAQ